MAIDEEELRRHKEQFAARQAELSAAKSPFKQRHARDVEEQLRAETPLTAEQQNASPAERAHWRHQENDPRHVFPNSSVAAQQSDAHAQLTNLSQQLLPRLSEQELAQCRAEFSQRMDEAQQSLLHECAQELAHRQQPELKQER